MKMQTILINHFDTAQEQGQGGSPGGSIVENPSCNAIKSCPALCDPMDCSMPGLPVPHRLPEFAQVHVHGITDAILPSHLHPCNVGDTDSIPGQRMKILCATGQLSPSAATEDRTCSN